MSNNYKFEDLPDLLRGQNIIEAINFCQDFSVKRLSLIKSLDVDERQMALYYLPWVLEIFMKLAIVYCSETDKKNNAEIVFNICIKIIANQAYAFQESLRNDKCVFMENYIYYIERNQLENVFFDAFRHFYYFNNNIKFREIFLNKFHIPYYSILKFICFYHFCIELNRQDLLIKELDKFYKPFSLLTTSLQSIRREYIEKIKEHGLEGIIYIRSDKDLRTYPIIKIGSYSWCPIYFLIYYSLGNMLMYKLTHGDNKLHESIGLEVREKYLFEIVNDSFKYDGVFNEKNFKAQKVQCGSPDVVAISGDEIVFLDSKSTSPSIKILNLDKNAIEEQIEDLSDYVKTMFEHLYNHCFKNGKYIKVLKKSFCENNIYGILVLREPTFLNRQRIFEKAFSKVGISDNKILKEWMINHIAILDIYSIEKICFHGYNLADYMRNSATIKLEESDKLNKRQYLNMNSKISYEKYLRFYDYIKRRYYKYLSKNK